MKHTASRVGNVNSSECAICSTPRHRLAELCKRCKWLVDRVDIRGKANKQARRRALADAWDGTSFRCYYSGIALVDDNRRDPRYLTFDHLTPRVEDRVVACAACINDMKSDLAENEFRAVVIQLAHRFQGGQFDGRCLNLKFWKR